MGLRAPATQQPRWRQWWFVGKRTIYDLLHLRDTPHRIALGCAAGLAIMPLPIPGQVFLGALLARLVGGNIWAAIPWTWVNNPFTALFFLYAQYRLGLWCLPTTGDVVSFAELSAVTQRLQDAAWAEVWSILAPTVHTIALPALCGTAIAGSVLALVGYVVVRPLVTRVQQRQQQRRRQWWRRCGEPSATP